MRHHCLSLSVARHDRIRRIVIVRASEAVRQNRSMSTCLTDQLSVRSLSEALRTGDEYTYT